MHDISIIAKLNAEATAAEIPKLRNEGKYVVCVYAGLSYRQHEAFDTHAQAHAYTVQHAAGGNYGERTQILDPTSQTIEEKHEALTS